MVEALKRATARGVACRAMVDDLGSRRMIKSAHWREMQRCRRALGLALPVGNPLLRMLKGRIDLRNHRKIVVIDDTITYCGSQNCADPEFRVKAKYAPWVDAMVRFEGPIARQNQYLFAADWMAYVDERIDDLLRRPIPAAKPGITAQVVGSGPTIRQSAMPEMFETLMYSARRELVITTPYYVPDESMQEAICASARRGVATTIIFPARNDSRLVAAASRSNYADLLAAGVRIFEYQDGLLHTKSLDPRRRAGAHRLGQHGPAQLRSELREQHSPLRPGLDGRDPRAPAELHRPVATGQPRRGRGLDRAAPPLEQHRRHAGTHSLGNPSRGRAVTALRNACTAAYP